MMLVWVAAMAFFGSMSVGEVAPDFTVTDTDGTSWTLSKMVETGPVLVAFFPKAFTGG